MHFTKVECQLLNVEGIMKLEKSLFAIIVITGLWKIQQWKIQRETGYYIVSKYLLRLLIIKKRNMIILQRNLGGTTLTRWPSPDVRHLEGHNSTSLLFLPKIITSV